MTLVLALISRGPPADLQRYKRNDYGPRGSTKSGGLSNMGLSENGVYHGMPI